MVKREYGCVKRARIFTNVKQGRTEQIVSYVTLVAANEHRVTMTDYSLRRTMNGNSELNK